MKHYLFDEWKQLYEDPIYKEFCAIFTSSIIGKKLKKVKQMSKIILYIYIVISVDKYKNWFHIYEKQNQRMNSDK